MLFDILILFFIGLAECTLDYSDSIKAIVYNQIDPNDNSTGDVWFNTTGYGLADYGFTEIDDIGVSTYSSFNYLKAITSLAGEAAKRGLHGDVVLLYYKFVYAGQHEATRLDSDSDMILDIAEMLMKAQSETGEHDGLSLYEVLTSSVSSDAVLQVYQLAHGLDLKNPQKAHPIKSFANLYNYSLGVFSSVGNMLGGLMAKALDVFRWQETA